MKRVLVINGDQLLAAGVEKILTRELDLMVMSAPLQQDGARQKEIEHFRPDVIILDQGLQNVDLTSLLMMMQEFHEVRIIVININDNFVHIYDKQQVEVGRSTDLVAAIRREAVPRGLN